jgi:hypothetical protein
VAGEGDTPVSAMKFVFPVDDYGRTDVFKKAIHDVRRLALVSLR